MSGLERIVTPERTYSPGDLFKACTRKLCRFYIVRRVLATKEGYVNELDEMDDERDVHPMIAHYDKLRGRKVERKEAARLAWTAYGKSESTFYRRLRDR